MSVLFAIKEGEEHPVIPLFLKCSRKCRETSDLESAEDTPYLLRPIVRQGGKTVRSSCLILWVWPER